MNIFGIYLSLYFIKIYSKTHQITPFKKILGGTCPRTPKQSRSSATRRMPLRGTQLAPPKIKKKLAPLANPACAYAKVQSRSQL